MRTFSLICMLLFTGCSTIYHDSAPVKVIDSEEMTWIVEKTMTKYRYAEGRRLKLEHSAVCYDTAITGLRLEISSQEIITMCEARDLLVDLVEDFLREINSNPILGDQMSSYPFTASNMNIEINFESFFGMYVDPFYIGCIQLRNGMARYAAFDMKDEKWHSWHSKVESYAKSRELSMIARAAEKDYEAKACICKPNPLDDMMFVPEPENDTCPSGK